MGRKKKKVMKPWCWYCNREFDDDKILMQHQKAKHFKCHICHKKLYTGPGLAIHCMQVHKETIDKIPNSLPNRGSTEIEVYGMEGIPEEDVKAHEAKKNGGGATAEEEPPEKVARPSNPSASGMGAPPMMHPGMMPPMFGNMPPMMPGMMPMPGMPPMGMHNYPPMMRPPMPLPTPAPPQSSGGVPPLPPGPGPQMGGGVTTTAASSSSSQPTFPAYKAMAAAGGAQFTTSAPAPASIPTPTLPKPPGLITSGASTKIIHPDEDISLEEKRASLPKYSGSLYGPPQPGSVVDSRPPGGMPEQLQREAVPTPAEARKYGYPPMPMGGYPGRPSMPPYGMRPMTNPY